MAPKQPVAGPSRQKMPSTATPLPPNPSVSSFSPSRTHYALSTPVLGSAEKLQIWEISSDRVIAEWDVEGASKVTTISWMSVPTSSGGSNSQNKKKKRRRGTGALRDGAEEDVVVLTTSKAELVIFSPTSGSVLSKEELKEPVSAAFASEFGTILATEKNLILLSSEGTISNTFALPSGTPSSTAISVLPTSTPDVLHVLIGSKNVYTLHLSLSTSSITYTSSSLPVSTTNVTSLVPLPSSSQGTSFLVVSTDDRTVSQYTLTTPTSPPKLSYRYASPTLSPAHSLSLSSKHLSILHQSGEVSLFSIPTALDFARPKSDSKPSTVRVVEGKDERGVVLAGVEFGDDGKLVVGRLAGGGRVKWVMVDYELPEGGVRPVTVFKVDAQELVGNTSSSSTIPLQRFTAPSTSAQIEGEDETDETSALPTDVDMADLSLGERLLSIPNGVESHDSKPSKPTTTATATANAAAALTSNGPVTANSLTRLLTQAIHTSDPALLTLCLTHRDPVLIRNTIRKMPATMALPLLKACVERLGSGKGANKKGGGRGGGQNEQQGRGTVEWVKGVLVERGAILMTIPSLPSHLATLSRLLETRLQLNAPLLQLSGRLDLALAQITMRRIALEQAQAVASSKEGGEGERYVEGESDDDDDEEEVEYGDGDGEVEDVDMRVGSEGDDDEDDDDEDEDDSEEDSEDDEDPLDSGSEDGLVDLEEDESEEEDSEED